MTRRVAAIVVVFGLGQLLGAPARVDLHAGSNPVQLENAKLGTTEWQLTKPGWASGAIEGYASLTSVNRGGRIKFFVNTADPSFALDIFRLGYYGGTGGRRMLPTVTLPGTRQVIPQPDSTTGLIECNWVNPYVLDIPSSSDPTDWMSGLYVVKLTGSSGTQQYIVFVVRDDARASDLMMVQTVNTYQAYNVWGGKSLYGTIANRSDTANKADKVSFDRPYYGDEGNGMGPLFNWEAPMAQWLEREGYDVAYATNVDLDVDPSLLLNRKAFLSVGHDEYWSWRMRDHVEAARDRGVNLGFFSGNIAYWQVRYEASVALGMPARTLVGYKEHWQNDPIQPAYFKTTRFRSSTVNRPEDAMAGVFYVTQARPPFVVEDASHWAFTGTGLHNGDVLLNPDGSSFLGYEVDDMDVDSPSNTRRLAHSPATVNHANFDDMTIYRAPSGATVFSTGSIGWSTTVPQIQQITRNVLARLISNAFPDAPPQRPAPPAPFAAADVGTVGRAGFVSMSGPRNFVINGGGKSNQDGNDALYYVYQSLSGDGQIVARLTALQLYWDNRAGIMIRQSMSPDAKYVSLVGRPSETTGVLKQGVEFKVKSATGARPAIAAQADQNMPNWLKLTRTGDTFTASISADGVAWTVLGSTTLALGPNVFIGAFVAGSRDGVWTTAEFDNVSISGAASAPPPAPDSTPPAISIATPAVSAIVSGAVTMTAVTPDPDVAGISFAVDGVAIGSERTAAPYAITWNSASVADGTHTITATARDASGNRGTVSQIVITSNAMSGRRVPFDFNGDGRGDLAMFRPGGGTWIVPAIGNPQFGQSGDVPVPADYNGDGRADVAVYRPSTGQWFVQGQTPVQWGLPGDVPVPGDYDGDGRTDFAVFRTSDGQVATWWINGRAGSAPQWGLRGDIPVPADFDGDGKTDLAVWRPSTGEWFILSSRSGFTTATRYQFGLPGDVPIAGDFDGDGRADLAVFRPSTGTWYVAPTTEQAFSVQFGLPGDAPVIVDVDGDGVPELCVWRPGSGTWYIYNRVTAAVSTQALGAPGDVPALQRPRLASAVSADFDGDGRGDITVVRPSNGTWFIRYSASQYSTYSSMTWGIAGDISVAGDYDGDRRADVAVYRPSTGAWYIVRSSTGAGFQVQWGASGDVPVPADYDGDGRVDPAVYRPSTGQWWILLSSTNYASYAVYQWGLSGDRPVPGDFDGDGRADLAVWRPSTGQWLINLSSASYGRSIAKQWGLSSDVPLAVDVDGDGRADLVVYRPSTGEWYATDARINYSPPKQQWGLSGDVPVPLDYDGDGRIDTAIFRASDGGWYVRRSSDGTFVYVQWGVSGDRPFY